MRVSFHYLSPRVAEPLQAARHDVIIARVVGLRTAIDEVVIAAGRRDDRMLVSANTGFGSFEHPRSLCATTCSVVSSFTRRPRNELLGSSRKINVRLTYEIHPKTITFRQ